MSKISHTPGPWERRGLTVFEIDKTALSVATASQHQPQARANAALISAAPELLAALQAAVRHEGDTRNPPWWIDDARAALEKAGSAS